MDQYYHSLSVNPTNHEWDSNLFTQFRLKVRGPALPGSFPGSFADPRDAMACTNSNMAAGSSSSSSNFDTSQQVDRIALLYPKVDESETPLPRSWSPKDKFTFIGLSQNNLKVHYKGRREIWSIFCVLRISRALILLAVSSECSYWILNLYRKFQKQDSLRQSHLFSSTAVQGHLWKMYQKSNAKLTKASALTLSFSSGRTWRLENA